MEESSFFNDLLLSVSIECRFVNSKAIPLHQALVRE